MATHKKGTMKSALKFVKEATVGVTPSVGKITPLRSGGMIGGPASAIPLPGWAGLAAYLNVKALTPYVVTKAPKARFAGSMRTFLFFTRAASGRAAHPVWPFHRQGQNRDRRRPRNDLQPRPGLLRL